jgi:hypothetical protein
MEPQSNHRTVGVERLNHQHRRKKSSQASRIENGVLLPKFDRNCTDGRSAWCRRLREAMEGFLADRGGWGEVSAGQMALIRRASVLVVELEKREVGFSRVAQADDVSLAVYSTVSNTLRRLLSELGLERKQRDVTPLEDLIAESDARDKAEPGP